MKKSFIYFTGLALMLAAGSLCVSAQDSPAAVFNNPAAITIASAGQASPYPSTINVTGLTGSIASTPGSIKVTFNNFSHAFPDDVGMVLVSPGGTAFLMQDGATTGPPNGNPATNVTYSLSDAGATPLPNTSGLVNGTTYQPGDFYGGDSFPSPGPGTNYADPAPTGSATFTSTFGGASPNGTWSLYVFDFNAGDAGAIANGWSLEINTAAAPAHDALVDMNGDGTSDYVITRPAGSAPSSVVTWWILQNGNSAISSRPWGVLSDFYVPADFDGDFHDDIAIWRPGPSGTAAFYIINSQTNTFSTRVFGQTGDDPTIVGDYNGDNKDDVAVYRGGATTGAQATWYYQTAPSTFYVAVNWGQGPEDATGDFPAPGDYDGDNKYDFVIQRNEGGNGRFWMYLSGGGIDSQLFGSSSDTIVPGDYDGDGKHDIATITVQGDNSYLWRYRPSSAPASGPVSLVWGSIIGAEEDVPVAADYNGDGKTDFAIWRQGTGTFWVYTSMTNSIIQQPWGQLGDYPPANFPVQ